MAASRLQTMWTGTPEVSPKFPSSVPLSWPPARVTAFPRRASPASETTPARVIGSGSLRLFGRSGPQVERPLFRCSRHWVVGVRVSTPQPVGESNPCATVPGVLHWRTPGVATPAPLAMGRGPLRISLELRIADRLGDAHARQGDPAERPKGGKPPAGRSGHRVLAWRSAMASTRAEFDCFSEPSAFQESGIRYVAPIAFALSMMNLRILSLVGLAAADSLYGLSSGRRDPRTVAEVPLGIRPKCLALLAEGVDLALGVLAGASELRRAAESQQVLVDLEHPVDTPARDPPVPS